METSPLHVRGKLDGAWYPIDCDRTQIIPRQNESALLRIRKRNHDAVHDEVISIDEMYKRIRCGSRLATMADLGLFREGLFIVGLAEMKSGAKKWCDCEIVKRMPEQGEYEVRVKWHNAGEGPLEGRQPVNSVLDLQRGPCIQLKTNRDVGSHPRFRHWLKYMEMDKEADNSGSVNGGPVVVDLTTPTPGNSPQSSPAIVMPPQQRARLRQEGRVVATRKIPPGDPRGFRPGLNARRPEGQEVVDLLDDDGLFDSKLIGSLHRGFRRPPIRRGTVVQQIPINPGFAGQKPGQKFGGKSVLIAKPESSALPMGIPGDSLKAYFQKDKRDVDMQKRLPLQSDQFGGLQQPSPPQFGGLVSSGSQNLLAEETLDFEDVQGYPGNRIDLTCEEDRIQEPMRWGLSHPQMFSNPSNMRPYGVNAYPQSFRQVQGGGLATDLRGDDTSLMRMGVQEAPGAWLAPRPPPSRGLYPPVNPASQADILSVFPQPMYPYGQIQHVRDDRLALWGTSSRNYASKSGAEESVGEETDAPKTGDFSEVSRLGLLYLATCCFRDDDHTDHLKLAKQSQILDGEGLKRRKISWNDI